MGNEQVPKDNNKGRLFTMRKERGAADVMVLGGGVSGIQASLDLAASGFRVYLVDRSPAIGGHMAQLDKTYPTNDCSMWILSPKLVEVDRHPNIEVLTYTEVDGVEGDPGDFTVRLTRKPRYIREDKCTGCGMCTEYCPVRIPDPFNQELSQNKAVHVYFAQAIPLIAYIDENCLYLKENKCRICEAVCENDAIDLNQAEERMELNVGAVLVAAGYDVFDPSVREVYGYGKMRNVVTSMDYERLLCATGPYGGEIRRPSDKAHPEKIAWIQCVGSRRVTPGDNSYCSGVCCTYTQKQLLLTKDHDKDTDCTVFHNDIRSFGKDFERYFQRAQDLPGVRFIRSYPSVVKEDPETGNVLLRYAGSDGVKEEEFDLLVLSAGLNPPAGNEELAEKLGIELNGHGFAAVDAHAPTKTARPGIFVSGAFQGPMDIPESVYTAGAAGARCGEFLDRRRGKLNRDRIYPPERDTSGEEPRIGVFVCHCGANIGRVVDVPSVVDFSLSLPGVVYAQEQLFSCATNSAHEITEIAGQEGLNRVVVAACSPRTLEPLFRDTLREAGINQYFCEMANIREHGSWVHPREPEEATQKAKELVAMSAARAGFLEPLQDIELPVNPRALVVGGGVAGMTCALSIANQGHEVQILEKDKELGGMARRLHTTIEGMDVQAYLADLIGRVYKNPLIHVCHEATIRESGGYIGNFFTTVESEGRIREIKHGATVIAVGAEEYKPSEYLYGENDRVFTHMELGGRIAEKDEKVVNAQTVVMIQCVGCRNEDRNYCSRVCCSHAVKNALTLKRINPDMQIYILFRDMRTYGFKEDYYRQASESGVYFIRYEPEEKPVVEPVTEGGKQMLRVTVPDPVLGHGLELDADVLSLAAAVIPSASAEEVARMFKVGFNEDAFFKEAHVKLRPVEFAADGVFLCGTAHYPKHITETISQAYGAAGRVLTLLSNDTVTVSGAVCEVTEQKCMGCGACVEACTYQAIELVKTKQGKKARVNPVLCKGDGLCNAKCPTGAIFLKHFTDDALRGQIDSAAPQEVLQKIDAMTEEV